MRESIGELMNRLAAGVQGPHWIRTSVGMVNTRNKASMLRKGAELAKKRAEKK